jgi:hypothetical protein
MLLSALLLLAAAVDFQREVRPILSNNCFQCHGFNQESRMADLRLDTKEGAFAKAIVPGDPAKSPLWLRVDNANAAQRMPPAYSHKVLTSEQKDTLKRWIEQGAPWKEHWSFAPPARPQLPPVSNTKWPRHPIDRFVMAKLDAAGLQPAPEADRRTLIRRLSFDLNGLPPEPAAVEAFVSDHSPNYYEALVDRLLASPKWGEHRGRYWLDAARYADTHGIHIDNYRELWPYRDWVIKAFNRNLPFDQFTIEQLAGDLLPNRTLDQLVASGFHRCNITTNEGGVIPEEFEAIYAKDRVDTTGAVFLGLTLGCSTCHDHKFDPLLQREYYQMAAFFRNTTQKPLDGNIRDTPPIAFVPSEKDRDRWTRLTEEERRLKAMRARERDAAESRFANWKVTPLPASPVETKYEAMVLPADVEFSGKQPKLIPDEGSLNADRPFTIATWVYVPLKPSHTLIASRFIAKAKGVTERVIDPNEGDHNGWFLDLTDRYPRFALIGDGDRDRITVRSSNRLTLESWHHVAVSYDGSRRYDGVKMYVDGELATAPADTGSREIQGSIENTLPLKLGEFEGGKLRDFRIISRAIAEEEAPLIAGWRDQRLGAYYRVRVDPQYKRFAAQLASVQDELAAIRRRGGLTHIMVEKLDDPFANVLYRGMYDAPRERVEPNVPGILPPMSANLPRNRLGLAKWLVDPANPLLARVTVNRFWQEVFGTGIVRTAEDFGSQGEAPSHPELLDWLAVEFRESGWDVKKFYKLMVTSAAYRQSALAAPEKLQKDPQNRLLSRGPRYRLDGEEVRDLALAAGGLLDPRIGGPSVRPYQPKNVWETVAMDNSDTRFYIQDHGADLYRRSLYTFWKRSAPPPSMDIFNAPTRELCTVKRERTNTPLQALVVMNDVQFVEAARNLAEHAMRRALDPAARLDYITSRVLARPFETKEREIVAKELRDLLRYYDTNPAEAKKLIAAGESKSDPKLAAPEFAAWTMIASGVLNLDEALNK